MLSKYWRQPWLKAPGVGAVVVQVATIEGGRKTIVEVAAFHQQQKWQQWKLELVAALGVQS